MSRAVLVVEDDAALRQALARALQSEGFSVAVSGRGDDAIRSLRTSRPDAVVVGLLLPGRSGFEVAAAARGADGLDALPVLALTGTFTGPRNRADALRRLGLVDLVTKPVDPLAIAESIRIHLDSASGRQDSRPDELPADDATQPNAELPAFDSTRSDAAADTGDLVDVAFGRLLHALHIRHASGILALKRGRTRKEVFFEEGEPVHVRGNVLAECLGRVLAADGVISETACRRSVRLLKERNTRQGEILVEMGLIERGDLAAALVRQLRVKLLDVFSWESGRFRFVASDEAPPARARLPGGVALVVSEGVRRWVPWPRIEQELRLLGSGHPVWGSSPRLREQELGLEPTEEEFFAQLDGRRTVGEAIAASDLGREAAGRLLIALQCTRKLEVQAGRESRQTERVPGPGLR